MMTAEEIINEIRELHKIAQKDKADIWDKATDPGADAVSVQKLHMYMGECAACETLLGIITGEDDDALF